jgi:hypothetical protein
VGSPSKDRDQIASERVQKSAGVEKNEQVTYPYRSRPVFPQHPRSLWPHPRPIEPMARLCYTQSTLMTPTQRETKQTDAPTSDHQIYALIRQECQALRGRLYIRDLARSHVGSVTAYDRIGRREGPTGGVNHPCAWIDAQDLLERRQLDGRLTYVRAGSVARVNSRLGQEKQVCGSHTYPSHIRDRLPYPSVPRPHPRRESERRGERAHGDRSVGMQRRRRR